MQRGEEAFQIWWSELDSQALSRTIELNYESARAVWLSAYEHSADCIDLVYDGAESSVDGAHPTGELPLACVVHRHHNGSISFPRRDFCDWAAKHEDHDQDPMMDQEQKFLLQQAGKRAGWDAPAMDAYDDYDAHRPKP